MQQKVLYHFAHISFDSGQYKIVQIPRIFLRLHQKITQNFKVPDIFVVENFPNKKTGFYLFDSKDTIKVTLLDDIK